MGVTGARTDLPADLEALVRTIRSRTDKPIAIGFGISRPEHVGQVCRFADGAVVGSALVSLLDREGPAQRRAVRSGIETGDALRLGERNDPLAQQLPQSKFRTQDN